MTKNDILTLAQRLREYNHNPHHINPASDAFHGLITDSADALAQLAAIQGGMGEVVEVVAWQDADNPLYTTGERRQMHGWATDGYPIVELCRLSDALRAIAELREECERLRKERDAIAKSQRYGQDAVAISAERDTLCQQLAERDATIERLEAGIPRIQEQSHQMRKLRDKLEGLLLDLWEYTHDPELEQRIEAALAEVKP